MIHPKRRLPLRSPELAPQTPRDDLPLASARSLEVTPPSPSQRFRRATEIRDELRSRLASAASQGLEQLEHELNLAVRGLDEKAAAGDSESAAEDAEQIHDIIAEFRDLYHQMHQRESRDAGEERDERCTSGCCSRNRRIRQNQCNGWSATSPDDGSGAH